MAPYVYYYKADKWFVYKIIENAVLGLGMLGFINDTVIIWDFPNHGGKLISSST